jgi:hypothetical protein
MLAPASGSFGLARPAGFAAFSLFALKRRKRFEAGILNVPGLRDHQRTL